MSYGSDAGIPDDVELEVRELTEEVYAVVQGPSALPLGWSKLSSLEELFTLGSSGLYIGHTDGYYLMNTITDNGSRTGITKTKPSNPFPSDSASLYYFEQVSGAENQVYVYCLDDKGKRQYVCNNNNNSLSFTDEENKTAFNDLAAGVFAATNPKNLYNATIDQLPDSDPRKYEQMYLVKNPDYYFGVELEASFTQPPNGLDEWGHDISYESTGYDDFWLYVDGELIIDLGGIHSALAGSVNYSTREVVVNGKKTTLRELLKKLPRTKS